MPSNFDKTFTSPQEFHHMMEYPWKASVFSFIPVIPIITPDFLSEELKEERYAFSKELPGFLHDNWNHIERCTLIDPFRLGWLVDLVVKLKNTKGDIVECGSFKGGAGILMALVLRHLGIEKKVHLFDSFEGLPEPDKKRDSGYNKGMFVSNYQGVLEKIKKLELDDRMEVHQGLFKDTIQPFLEKNTLEISLLHIDCDLYQSTRDCFIPLYPKVVEGGAIILDDFNDGCKGEKEAVLELLSEEHLHIQVGPTPQAFFIKNEIGNPDDSQSYKMGNQVYSFRKILQEKKYLDWLSEQLEHDYEKVIKEFLHQ